MPAENNDVVIEHPNRHKATSKATKAVVILLLIASAALVLVVTIGGWDATAGAQPVSLAFAAIYLLMAFYVAKWNRGVLPVSAALAMILGIFAAVSVPGWFDRNASGYTDPALSAGLLGLITAIIVPVQILLIAFSMRGFQQAWNVEVERLSDGTTRAVPSN
jgi:FtsH-binding integral membrane protein